MKRVKKLKSESTELPDCVISDIFSKLSLRNLVKTSVLSKQWFHEWGLRKDLNFDLHNMFDYNTMPELPKTLPLLQQVQSQFATRLDNFMLKYHGDIIRSIRVNFPLGHDHTDVIDRLFHKGVLKGANRIELLFTYKANDDTDFEVIKPYKFSFPFSCDTNSLTYLHLQNCQIAEPMKFSGLKNLTTLVFHLIPLKQNILQDLFLYCIHLENFTLNKCTLGSDIYIISPTLLHLKIKCGDMVSNSLNIDIIASNLSSFEYSSKSRYYGGMHRVNIMSPMLSKFSYVARNISKYVDFSELKNLTTIVLDRLLECIQSKVIPHLFSNCLQLEDLVIKNCKFKRGLKIISTKLRHLSIINCWDMNFNFYKIYIDALNLTSFEYRGLRSIVAIKAPKLLKVFWDARYPSSATIARLHRVENLVLHVSLPLMIPKFVKNLVRFQNLRQLELFIRGSYDPNIDYFWILDIAMASQHLQKLSLTIKYIHEEKSHIFGSYWHRREYARFFHNNLEYVKLHGCVCSTSIIELASQLLKSAKSLKQITFSSRDDFYIGDGIWTEGSNGCCCFEGNLIHELLKDEINQQCQLIIL